MVTVGVILFAFTAVVAAVALYGIFVLRDDERRGEAEQGDAKAGGLKSTAASPRRPPCSPPSASSASS